MPLQYNQTYQLFKMGREASSIGSSLLKAYPLTRSCLSVLGDHLLKALEFGFFTKGHQIITQGETGKDLFLLCEGKVEVLVNQKVVVELEPPALLGDKGIIQLDSKRAATIQTAGDCLFIKIPMDRFLRNLDDRKLPDKEFRQEAGIYGSMFMAIQNRLFTYMSHQKNLWDQVTATLNLLNSKLLAKALSTGKTDNWSEAMIKECKALIREVTGFAWTDDAPLTGATFLQVLPMVLARKTQPLAGKIPAFELQIKRKAIWNQWVDQIAVGIATRAPKEKLPVHIGEIELFHPKLYRIKLQTLLKSYEKRVRPKEGKDPAGHNMEAHFQTGEKANFLDLFGYMESFRNHFQLTSPHRIEAMISQKVALLAAQSENDFNASIVRMQGFMDRVQGMALKLEGDQGVKKITSLDEERLKKEQEGLFRSYDSFAKKRETLSATQKVGQVFYMSGMVPRMGDLVQASGSSMVRSGIEQSFRRVVEMLGLLPPDRGVKIPAKLLYMRKSTPGFRVPAAELAKGWWIPISPGVTLWHGDEKLSDLKPGSLVGGKGMVNKEEEESGGGLHMRIPARAEFDPIDMSYCLFVIPFEELPWLTENPLTRKEPAGVQEAMVEWLVDIKAAQINRLVQTRDEAYEKWIKIEQVVRLERKLQIFEQSSYSMTSQQRRKMMDFLLNVLGMRLDVPTLPSNQLAKKIYNHILRNLKAEMPHLTVDELGNKAYTKFRLHLSELVQLLEHSAPKEEDTSMDRLEVEALVEKEFKGLLAIYGLERFDGAYQPLEGKVKFFIKGLAKELSADRESMANFFGQFFTAIEALHLDLMQEVQDLEDRLRQVRSVKGEINLEEMQTEVIHQAVDNFKNIIQEKMSEVG